MFHVYHVFHYIIKLPADLNSADVDGNISSVTAISVVVASEIPSSGINLKF